jgi:hypothetical protein
MGKSKVVEAVAVGSASAALSLEGVVDNLYTGLQVVKGITPFNILFGLQGHCEEATVKAVAAKCKVPYVMLKSNGFQVVLSEENRQVLYKSSDGMACNLCGFVLKDKSLSCYGEKVLLKDFLTLYPKVRVYTYEASGKGAV